jgi:exodeoxyribonuclease-3
MKKIHPASTRIVTWNINSVRIRIPLLKRMANELSPDIICLQETKATDEDFPLDALRALGFPFVYFTGQKSYNGVAILSKLELTNIRSMPMADSTDKRHISATLPDGTELHNFYVPAGGDIPDATINPAYGFKLKFVEGMTSWAHTHNKKGPKLIILGDFNIAPLPHDVWSHKQLLGVVSHTPAEVERLDALKSSLAWCDAGRHFISPDEKLYSWWSYRNRDWRKSNRGRRLDHIWITPPLVNALKAYHVHVDARDWKIDESGPSDHVPVMIDIAL